MKKYQKAQMIAKNLPTGSYAAGCPAKERGDIQYDPNTGYMYPISGCRYCERQF